MSNFVKQFFKSIQFIGLGIHSYSHIASPSRSTSPFEMERENKLVFPAPFLHKWREGWGERRLGIPRNMSFLSTMLVTPANYIPTLFFILLLHYTVSLAGEFQIKADDLYKAGKYREAVSAYKEAVVNGENKALCYFNCANAYFQLDSLSQSIVYYKAALVYAPDFFRGHLNLAIVYFTLEEIGECIAAISRALELQPDDDKALLIQAVCYRKVGAIPEAVVAFENIISHFPEKEEAYIALAEMYRDLSDDQKSIEWLLKYPESGKNEAYVNFMLSDIYEAGNNFERAIYFSQRTFEKEPDNRNIFFKICSLLERMGNDLVALEEIKRGIELFPDFGDLAVFGGNIAMKYEKLDDAQRLYSAALKAGNPYGVVGIENIRKIIANRNEGGE